jgi:hypothetical protein
MTPLQRLRHHVSGAIERGEGVAIVGDPVRRIGKFNVRIVHKGGAYGLQDCLTHDQDDPLVEFYDAKWAGVKFGPRGQFVSRYYAGTLLESDHPDGLALDGAISEWAASPQDMQQVIEFIKESS